MVTPNMDARMGSGWGVGPKEDKWKERIYSLLQLRMAFFFFYLQFLKEKETLKLKC